MVSTPSISLDTYWTSFEAGDDDIDYIINLLLEREIPLTTEEMTQAIVVHRLERLEEEVVETETIESVMYLPAETYKKKDTLTFPALGHIVGEVTGKRSGENPELGKFDVIKVKFEDGSLREFATNLPDHILNHPPEPEPELDETDSADFVMERYGSDVGQKLEAQLESSEDIIRIAGKWFPRALVADITEGHLNIAEAVLDVASGGPLPTSDLLEHIELPSDLSPQLAEFSVDYALQEDDRFDEVGPAGEVLWFLKRLEPPEVLYTPPRLEYGRTNIERGQLTDDLLELEKALDDELNPSPDPIEPVRELTLPLLFPHWRVGALPLSPRLRTMFPTAYEAPRIRVMLVDAHSGDKFEGWVVRNEGYVFGLESWFNKYDVPAGGLVTVRAGEEAGEVVVETNGRRMRNDWIRTVTIDEEGLIGFTMLKQPVGTEYDDLMVIGLIDPQVLDEAWLQGSQRKTSIDRVVAHVFRELAKLTPQSAVHARTLYAGVNVIQRHPPAVVFHELVSRPYYVHVGDLYWRFEPSAWNPS